MNMKIIKEHDTHLFAPLLSHLCPTSGYSVLGGEQLSKGKDLDNGQESKQMGDLKDTSDPVESESQNLFFPSGTAARCGASERS